jgi:hypothetical protein
MKATALTLGLGLAVFGMGAAWGGDVPVIRGQAPQGQNVKEIVDMVQTVILKAMAGDKETVSRYFTPNAELMFVGRKLGGADEIGKFNATRYQWVKKSIDQWDVTYSGKEMVVTSVGTLYGVWSDGTEFKGNRYIDRFILVDGKITRMDVWNDGGEILLKRAGLVKN